MTIAKVGSHHYPYLSPACPVAVGKLPAPCSLDSLDEIDSVPHSSHISDHHTSRTSPPTSKETPPVTVGPGLPPVPGKLVRRIEAGHFIEMGELLPEHLGLININAEEDGFKALKKKN